MRKTGKRSRLERFLLEPNDPGAAMNVLTFLTIVFLLTVMLKSVYDVVREGITENGLVLGIVLFLAESIKMLIGMILISGLAFIVFVLIIAITTVLINVITNVFNYLLRKGKDKDDEQQ